MATLLHFLSLFVLLSLSHSESRGLRSSICNSNNKGFIPKKHHGPRPKLDENQYNVTISLIKNNKVVTCVENNTQYIVRINATKYFKGFIITSTRPGTGYPANFVGKFKRKVYLYSDENIQYACDNTISHSDILKKTPVDLVWKSSKSNREVEFLYAVVFSRRIWLANLTTRFSPCPKLQAKPPTPKCIKRVEPDASGSGDELSNATTDLPGSAVPESKCEPVKTQVNGTLLFEMGGKKRTVKYKCTGYAMRCRGNCTYCDQGCKSVRRKPMKITVYCITDKPSTPYLYIKQSIHSRQEVQVDQECKCTGKYDSEEDNES